MKKNSKVKSSQTKESAAQDIVGLVTTLVDRLVSLEAKMDTVLSRLPSRPVEAPKHHQPSSQVLPPQQPASPPVNRRPMYTAVCADCGKSCEVPFKPSEGRSVYCKGCYSVRRNNNSSNAPRVNVQLKAAEPLQAPNSEKPQAAKPSPSAGKKKPAAKKAKKIKKR